MSLSHDVVCEDVEYPSYCWPAVLLFGQPKSCWIGCEYRKRAVLKCESLMIAEMASRISGRYTRGSSSPTAPLCSTLRDCSSTAAMAASFVARRSSMPASSNSFLWSSSRHVVMISFAVHDICWCTAEDDDVCARISARLSMTAFVYICSYTNMEREDRKGPSDVSVHGFSCEIASVIWLRVRNVATRSFEGVSFGEMASSSGGRTSPVSIGATKAGPPRENPCQLRLISQRSQRVESLYKHTIRKTPHHKRSLESQFILCTPLLSSTSNTAIPIRRAPPPGGPLPAFPRLRP